MYLALFLTPWLAMYALSTMAMNHHGFFVARHGEGPAPWHKEREFIHRGALAADAAPEEVARSVLAALDLDGSHAVNRRPDGAVVINRQDLVSPRRITYTPADQKVMVEKTEPRFSEFLGRFHRRRGYETGYGLDTAWAVTVDLVIAAMVFWVLSGLWMWWEMRATRMFGAVAVGSGVVLFVFYLVTL